MKTDFEAPLMPLSLTETFAGPEDELDKLEAINWNQLSSEDDSGSFNDFVSVQRLGPNSLRLEVIHHSEIC